MDMIMVNHIGLSKTLMVKDGEMEASDTYIAESKAVKGRSSLQLHIPRYEVTLENQDEA